MSGKNFENRFQCFKTLSNTGIDQKAFPNSENAEKTLTFRSKAFRNPWRHAKIFKRPHSEYCHIFTEPQQELYKDVQMIALHGHIPDSYMWALLKLARTCDAFQASTAPILEHQFDYKDNLRAIANIDKLVMMEDSRSKLKEKKYKRQTGNFDDLFNLDS